ncbi:PKD domain-containing protein, partial [Algoriphagus mannitolivorans]|uniref:PKD domain-containing protein n=1 Tax=Algoriphagus mannitolivorans TaxID=226504 RepID=UPI001FE00210
MTGFSQGNIIGQVPIVIDPLNPPGCPQNNVNIAAIEFRDENGFQFPSPYDPPGININDEVPGEIWVKFGGSTSNAFNLYAQFDVFINGVKSGATRTLCLFGGQRVPTQDGEFYYLSDFVWNFGDKVEIKNIYMTWRTGNAGNGNCEPRLQNSQCYFNPTGLVVNTPLVANFDFVTNCFNRSVQFTDKSTGGDPNFSSTYSWNFGDGSAPVTSQNPTYTYASAGTYNVTLTVTKQGISKQITKSVMVYDPTSLTINSPPAVCEPGSVDLTAASVTQGSTPGLEFSYWTDDQATIALLNPDQVTISGTYYIKAVDPRDCE